VIKTCSGAYRSKPGFIKEQLRKDGVNKSELNNATYPFNLDQQKWKDAQEKCCKEYLSAMILMQANRDKRCDLANDMSKHVDNYPKTIVDTTCMLNY
jgi:hypothetical protein